MPIPQEDYELAKRLLTDKGEANPEEKLNAELRRIRAEGRAQTDTRAIKELISDLATVEKPLDSFSGVILAMSLRGIRTDFIVGTLDGCWSVSGLPPETARYRPVTAMGVTMKQKLDTGTRWVEMNGGTFDIGEPVGWAEISKVVTPFGSIKGRNQMVLTTAQIRFVNGVPKEKYNKDKPFLKGQKRDTFPVWDAPSRRFALRLTFGEGQVNGTLNLFDEHVIEQLFRAGEITDRFWSWFYNPETPDDDRLEELSVALRGETVVLLAQATDEINGAHLKALSLQLRGGGWIMLKENFVASVGGVPHTPTPGEGPNIPSVPAPTLRSLILGRFTDKGEIGTADLKALFAEAVKLGLDDKAVKDEMVALQGENVIIQTGGKFKKR